MTELMKNIIFFNIKNDEQLLIEFKQHYIENCSFVRTVVYWIVRSDDVDDIIQETFVKAWKKYKTFKNKSSFKTWIYKIAKNTAYDFLKKNRKYNELKELREEALETKNDINQNLSSLITEGLGELSPKHKEIFILFYKLSYTSKEISKLLKISEGTVKSRLFYARDIFKNYLKQQGVYNG